MKGIRQVRSAGLGIMGLALALGQASHAQQGKVQEGQLLLSFETPTDLARCEGATLREWVSEHVTEGQRALRMDLSEPSPFLLIRSGEKPFDFAGYERHVYEMEE